MLYRGDNIEILRAMPENSVATCITDPPYGLAFMGHAWDYNVPSVEAWREVLRVLKPGGHLLSFGGTRTYHRLVVNIEDAGFFIRDKIEWIYGSGFPKSRNFPKYELEGELAETFKGYGTNNKPGHETICVAMKPLNGTYGENAEKWGVAGLNIDAASIPTNGEEIVINTFDTGAKPFGGAAGERYTTRKETTRGRWPSNVLFDEAAAEELNHQTGTLKSGAFADHHKANSEWPHRGGKRETLASQTCGDSGGASRFFYCAKPSNAEKQLGLSSFPPKKMEHSAFDVCGNCGSRIYQNLARKSHCKCENPKREGVTIKGNHHPTVKPIALMQYLCKWYGQPDGNILDPYMGSGTTGIGAYLEGFDFIGIEQNKEYFDIAQARISHAHKMGRQLNLFD